MTMTKTKKTIISIICAIIMLLTFAPCVSYADSEETINWYINLNGNILDAQDGGVSGRTVNNFTSTLNPATDESGNDNRKSINTDINDWNQWFEGTTEIVNAEGETVTVNNSDYKAASSFNGMPVVLGASSENADEIGQVIASFLDEMVDQPLTDAETLQAVKNYLDKDSEYSIVTINGDYVDSRLLEQVDENGDPIYYTVQWYVVKKADNFKSANPYHVDGVLKANEEEMKSEENTVTLQYVLLEGDVKVDQALPYNGNVVTNLKPSETVSAVTVTTGLDENTQKTYNTDDIEVDGQTYSFSGWHTNEQLNNEAEKEFSLVESVTLYGKWLLKSLMNIVAPASEEEEEIAPASEEEEEIAPVSEEEEEIAPVSEEEEEIAPVSEEEEEITPASEEAPAPAVAAAAPAAVSTEDYSVYAVSAADNVIELDDEDVPLAAVPNTGDSIAVYLSFAALAALGVLFTGKKKLG